MRFNKNTLLFDIPNSEYHGVEGTFSSSQLKDILDDPEIFYRKHVSKEIERTSSANFDVGTYYHTAVLEPDKIQEDCVVFEGIRRGKKWEQFKEDHADKAIITKSEFATASAIIEATKNSEVAMGYIEQGQPEVSAFIELVVDGPDIYCEGKLLTDLGWRKTPQKPSKSAVTLVVKCRADCLGDDFILDLKSTTGNAKSSHKVRQTISHWSYDLSAAFYLDVFSAVAGKDINTFIWTFASKDLGNCKSWVASKETIAIGRAKWTKAVSLIAHYQKNGWTFYDTLDEVTPQYFEKEWLEKSEEDML